VPTCRKLIASMPKRIVKVLQNKGGYTGYEHKFTHTKKEVEKS